MGKLADKIYSQCLGYEMREVLDELALVNRRIENKLPQTNQDYIKPPKCEEPKPDVIPPSQNKQDEKSDRWFTPEQIDEFLKIASDLAGVLYRMEKKMYDKNVNPFLQK